MIIQNTNHIPNLKSSAQLWKTGWTVGKPLSTIEFPITDFEDIDGDTIEFVSCSLTDPQNLKVEVVDTTKYKIALKEADTELTNEDAGVYVV